MINLFYSLVSKAHTALEDDSTMDLVERVATKTAIGSSGVTIVSGLTINEWGVIVGGACAIVTTVFTIWFKMKYQRGKKR